MPDEPGTHWLYNTGNVQLLSAIVKKTTGLYLHEFAEKYLFGPLKIENTIWNADPSGYTCAGGSDGGLRIKSRDLAKLGCLYTNDGIWEGQRIVSEEWIEQSTTKYITTREDRGYGYLWHVYRRKHNDGEFDCYYHTGSGGHILMVLPELNLVIVMNSVSGNALPLIQSIIDIVERFA